MNTITFYCRDCGHDCSFKTTGNTERQVKQNIIEHMHTVHSLGAIPADILLKIHTSIRNNFEPGQVRSEDAMADTVSERDLFRTHQRLGTIPGENGPVCQKQ